MVVFVTSRGVVALPSFVTVVLGVVVDVRIGVAVLRVSLQMLLLP